MALALILSVFQYFYPGYGNNFSRKVKASTQYSKHTVVHFAFNFRVGDHVSPFLKAANMLIMEDTCRIMKFFLVHKTQRFKKKQNLSERLS